MFKKGGIQVRIESAWKISTKNPKRAILELFLRIMKI